MKVDTPAPRTELIVAMPPVVVRRIHGRLRDPEDGRHLEVVVLVGPTMRADRLASYLRAVVDELEPPD